MFFHYHQNNSGGGFIINDNIHENIIIEARDNHHADTLAEGIGIYFDGISKGEDCECCGDRWSRQYSDNGEDIPSRYGEPVKSLRQDLIPFADQKINIIGYVYYLNGNKDLVIE